MEHPKFHTRHIPKELLNIETESGRNVINNGLCDMLDQDMLYKLRDLGVELVETRLVWWELERDHGKLDFDCLARRFDAIEKAGLKAGVFPWFQHPPTWYDPEHVRHVRFRCLEHAKESSVISIWDAETLEVYDRLYGALAKEMGSRISFLYAGITGDFGEVAYLSGVKHYLFSSFHSHHGLWCADRLARKSFSMFLKKKYETIDNLNKSWQTTVTDWADNLMPAFPLTRNSRTHMYDFAMWYVDSLVNFTDMVCELIRKHFKNTQIGVPLGFIDETLPIGQIKSKNVKVVAKYNMIPRWTGMAYLGEFARSNVLARRFASAAHFYGSSFACEAALALTPENAANGLYEAVANGACIIHDDPQNILGAREIHKKLRPRMIVDTPVSSCAIYYPVERELLEMPTANRCFPEKLTECSEKIIERAAKLREVIDYDICDSVMIADAYLDKITDIIFLTTPLIPEAVWKKIIDFVISGGRVWFYKEVEICFLELYLQGKNSKCDIMIKSLDNANVFSEWQQKAGFYRFEDYSIFKYVFGAGENETTSDACYSTVHKNCISKYWPKLQEFEISAKISKIPMTTAK
jgi:hypothetical protein